MKYLAVALATFFFALTSICYAEGNNSQRKSYLLDVAGCSLEEEYLIGVLQGIVNREEPRLYLTSSSATNVFADFLAEHKGIQWTRFESLDDALDFFCSEKNPDGTPKIKGIIVYDSWLKNQPRMYARWIAADLAILADALPASRNVINRHSFHLGQYAYWTTDTSMNGWAEMFTTAEKTEQGLKIFSRRADEFASKKLRDYRSKWVYLDLAQTPKIEITISNVDSEGSWGLSVDMGTTIDTFNNGSGVVLTRDRQDTGTFVFDMKNSGQFQPQSGYAQIKIHPTSPRGSITVKSVRLLDESGNQIEPFKHERKDWMRNLPVLEDLTDEEKHSYMKNEEEAAEWAVQNLLPQCASDEMMFAKDFTISTIDRAASHKSFCFYMEKNPYAEPFPLFDKIIGSLQSPALITGCWAKDESYFVHKIASAGHAQAHLCRNISFWTHIPHDTTIKLPAVRKVQNLENKVYVNFGYASADVLYMIHDMQEGLWHDPHRGSFPNTWACNGLLARLAPAMMEYYARTATENDSFWFGPSGAGYTSMSAMTPEMLDIYARKVRESVAFFGCGGLDFWDAAPGMYFQHTFRPFVQKETCDLPPVQLFTPNAWRDERNKINYWTEEGVPVFFPEKRLFSLWDNPMSGVDCTSLETSAQGIADRIIAVAEEHQVRPLFLTLNIRWSPTVLKMVTDLLPKDEYEVVGMPDFIALGQQAGRLDVRTQTTLASPSNPLEVEIFVRNATDTPMPSGEVRWELPNGWTSSVDHFIYQEIPAYSKTSQTITLVPPDDFVKGTAKITFADSQNRAVIKSLFLEGCQKTVSICRDNIIGEWKEDGVKIEATDNGVKIIPREQFFDSYNIANRELVKSGNGRAILALGEIDFTEQPFLLINLTDAIGKTRFRITNGKETWALAETNVPDILCIDLKSKLHWFKDKRHLSLVVEPGLSIGRPVTISHIGIGYK
ncbi:MAG: GxGYxYP domain-containing protein [Thermoguttaceae bacterium]